MRSRPRKSRRRGFTLVELLIVIVIVGILVALLIPAIAAAVRTANNGRVTAEINTFATALADFKNKYGEYPPSRIMLSETQDSGYSGTIAGGEYGSSLASFSKWLQFDPTSGSAQVGSLPAYYFGTDSTGSSYADLTVGQLYERSQRYMRKFFPKAAPPNMGASSPLWHDYNGNGQPDPGFIYLQGHECLAFFLGGIPLPSATFGMSGFGKNPARPFVTQLTNFPNGNAVPAYARTDNRTQPFFEFKGDRLSDNDDYDGIPGYLDTLNSGTSARFFAYFAAYGNNGYDPNDVNFLDNSNLITQGFRINVGTGNAATYSPSPNPYTSNDPAASGSRATFYNPTSFQIISAGADGEYGYGGMYTTSDTAERLPGGSIRSMERDNLANFTTGRLD